MTKKFEEPKHRHGKARVNSRAIMKAFVKRYESKKVKPKKSNEQK